MRCLLLSSLLWATLVVALNVQFVPPAAVDRLSEGYEWWRIADGGTSATATYGSVKITVTTPSDKLKGGRYKVLQQASTTYLGQWVIGAGISTETTTANMALQLQITGLTAGTHSVLAFHNGWDSLSAVSAINVAVNGQSVLTNAKQSVRQNSFWSSASTYVTFNVASTSTVTTILYTPTGSATDKRAYLNAIEIDGKNIANQVSFPEPPNNEEHVNADGGSFTLRYKAPASGAVSYDIYVSTTSAADALAATKASGAYKGSTTALTYALSSLSSLNKYWWRVDTVKSDGSVTQGRVFMFRPRQISFPGADGGGKYAIGGRGGQVLKVTNLQDYAAGETAIQGSFRWAATAVKGPRIIVFDVGGVVTLKDRLIITDKYVTIAGQTAPGKGIVIQGWPLGLSGATDVIIRHLRVRPGKLSGQTVDGMGMRGSNHAIFDHCSISWTIDESFSSRDAFNITLQKTFISEPLNAAGHQNYPAGTEHGYAASIGGDVGTFHHNLIAHANGRSWSMAGGLDNESTFAGRLSIVNNVVYNFGSRVTDGGASKVDFINNYYKPGPASSVKYALEATYEDNMPGMQQYHCAGNEMPGYFAASSTQVYDGNGAGACYAKVSFSPAPTYQKFFTAPFLPNTVEYQTSAVAYKRVLSDVGANIPALDDHDKRVLKETRDGTAQYKGSYTGKAGLIDDPKDVGGLESWPTTSHPSWHKDSNNDGIPDWWTGSAGAGYTPIEGFLNWKAEPHVFVNAGASVSIALADLGYGFKSPTFTATVTSGTVIVSGSTATYKAGTSATIASMTVSIKDSDGTTWTRNVGIAVLATTTSVSSAASSVASTSVASSTTSRIASTTSVAPSPTGTSPVYGQCGGLDWTGATGCVSGTTCTWLNDWYWQCVPN